MALLADLGRQGKHEEQRCGTASALGCARICGRMSLPRLAAFFLRGDALTRMPAAVEGPARELSQRRPSPMVRRVYVRRASDRSMPFIRAR